jgi:hypothetical protein
MLSKLQKGLLVLAAAAGVTLFAVGAGWGDEPPTKIKVTWSGIALSPADLAASVSVMNEQNLSPWIVTGIVKNVGGHDYAGKRHVTLQQVTGHYGPKGHRPTVVTLATMTVTTLKAGQSVSLQKVFTVQPVAGTRFQLVISPGDPNPDNDHAEIVFRGT